MHLNEGDELEVLGRYSRGNYKEDDSRGFAERDRYLISTSNLRAKYRGLKTLGWINIVDVDILDRRECSEAHNTRLVSHPTNIQVSPKAKEVFGEHRMRIR